MLKNLAARAASHTMRGSEDECWGWSASRLPRGRPRLGYRVEGRSRSITVARVLVADRDGLALDSWPRWVARHSCDNHECVNPSHLVAGTYAQNTADMWERGRGARGDRRPSSRLSADLVRSIRRRLGEGETQGEVARSLSIGQGHVSQVARRIIWGWVE